MCSFHPGLDLGKNTDQHLLKHITAVQVLTVHHGRSTSYTEGYGPATQQLRRGERCAGVQCTIVLLLTCEGQLFIHRSLQSLDQVDLSPPTRRRHLVPVTFRQACALVAAYHRHNSPPRGMKFVLGVAAHGELVGVATVGRPAARHLDDGYTAEVTRTCTDGTPNTNSMLLGAARRAARVMGYRMLITSTQVDEYGASLRAAGFVRVAELPARPGWHTPSRPRRRTSRDHVARVRWEIRAGDHVEARPRSGTPAGEGVRRAALLAPVLAPTTKAGLRPPRQRQALGRAGIAISPTYLARAREAINTISCTNHFSNSAMSHVRDNDTSQVLRRLNLPHGECGVAA